MTSKEPVYAFDELLALAQKSRPRFSDDQLRDVVWRFLWSGKLDGLIGLNVDSFLSALIQPSDPSAPRIAIRKTPEIRPLTTGNEIAELLVTTLALSSNGSRTSPADDHLFAAIRGVDLMSMDAIGNELLKTLGPLASFDRQALALVPEHVRKDAPVIMLVFAHMKFSQRAKQLIVEDIGSTAKMAEPAEELCRRWLVQRMREEAIRPQKKTIETDALKRFPGLTAHGFRSAWAMAAAEVPGTSWTKRGPKPRGGETEATG
jgi:hypothetical protein